jgi:hypothetical protein
MILPVVRASVVLHTSTTIQKYQNSALAMCDVVSNCKANVIDILATLGKFRKAAINFVMLSVCPSVCTWNYSAPTVRILIKFVDI